LTKERGVWSPTETDFSKLDSAKSSSDDIHWKLDRIENYQRMRKRLIQNFEFDNHAEASARRDRNISSSTDSTLVPKIERALMNSTAAAAA
jgi:hypothetical protein